MAVRTSLVSVSDGDQLNYGYFNGIYLSLKPKIIYTGSGLTVFTEEPTTATSTYEFSSISSSDLSGMNYLNININGLFFCARGTGITFAQVKGIYFQIQTKDIGGSYSDSMSNRIIAGIGSITSVIMPINFNWIHTLSANEKSAGVQVKVIVTGIPDNDTTGDDLEFRHYQSIISISP
jgi:hypothetical protein